MPDHDLLAAIRERDEARREAAEARTQLQVRQREDVQRAALGCQGPVYRHAQPLDGLTPSLRLARLAILDPDLGSILDALVQRIEAIAEGIKHGDR